MSMISDVPYTLHVVRLTHLQHNSSTSHPTPSQRLIAPSLIASLPALRSNPYIQGTGLLDGHGWPNIVGGLESPPLEGVDMAEAEGSDFELDEEEGVALATQSRSDTQSNGSSREGKAPPPRLTPSRSYIRRALDKGSPLSSPTSDPSGATDLSPSLPSTQSSTTPTLTNTRSRQQMSPIRSRSGDSSPLSTPGGPSRTPSANQDRDPTVGLRYSRTIGRTSNLGMGGIRINGKSGGETYIPEGWDGSLPSPGVGQSMGLNTGMSSSHATPTAVSSRLSDTAIGTDTIRLNTRRRSSLVSANAGASTAKPGISGTPTPLPATSGSGSTYTDRTPTTRTMSDLSSNRPNTFHLYDSRSSSLAGSPVLTSPSPPTSPWPDPEIGPRTPVPPPPMPAGSGLPAQVANMRTRARRPRADSAPMVAISSPGREENEGNNREEDRQLSLAESKPELPGILRNPTSKSSSRPSSTIVERTSKPPGRRGHSFVSGSIARPPSTMLKGLALNDLGIDVVDPPPVIGSMRDFFGPVGNHRQSVRAGGIGGDHAGTELIGYGTSVLGRAMIVEGLGGIEEYVMESPGTMDPLQAYGQDPAVDGSDTDGAASDYRSIDEADSPDEGDTFGGGSGRDTSYDTGTGRILAGEIGSATAMGSLIDPGQKEQPSTRHVRNSSAPQRPASPAMDFSKRILGAPQSGPESKVRRSNSTRKNASALSKLFRPASALSFGSDHSANANPFLGQYAAVPPPQGSSIPALDLVIFFPASSTPAKAVKITVRKDVTVEEVIGWACAQYWEAGRTPRLEDGHDGGESAEGDPGVWQSTAGWALRIVEDEDDGEVDEDFPALDREGLIAKFAFNAFAVVEASAVQIRQALVKQPLRPALTPQLTGRSARANSLGIGSNLGVSSATTMPMDSTQSGSPQGTATYTAGSRATTLGPSNPLSSGPGISTATQMAGVMVNLRVKIAPSPQQTSSTTINVPSDMYFADIVEMLVKKQGLAPPTTAEWVLILADMTMALPLDRTVESLMGNIELALVRRQWAERHKLIGAGQSGERRGGDPNASIFKRVPEASRLSGINPTSSYRKYIVQRKMPIGRHERILAIDGDYIHIMPTDNKTFFDSMKTSSFHITAVDSCKQSGKSPTNLKIMVVRDGALKRYDFEAENAGQASEIATTIKALMQVYRADKVAVTAPASKRVRRG